MKTARAFNLPGKSSSYIPTVTLDKDGWPTADFDVMVFTAQDPKYVSGTYKLSFNGQAVVKANGAVVPCSKTIVNTLSFGVLSDDYTCDVPVLGSQLVLSFTSTIGGSRNVSLIRPSASGVFNPKFLEKIKPFSVIRAMDLLHTNNSLIVNYTDRCKATNPSCAGRDMAYEDLIELANSQGKDLWINIPAMADDDYVQQLAVLLKEKLNKDRIIYVEYSNEVWNSIFTQAKWNTDQARADVSAGDVSLNDSGADTNTFYWGWKRVAKRLLSVSKVLKTALGNDRVRPILAMQAGNTDTYNQALKYIKKYYGEPKDFIYGIAGAPYFSTKERDNPAATQSSLLAGLRSSVVGNDTKWNLHKWDGKAVSAKTEAVQYAKYYGLRFLSYEAGPDTSGAAILDIKKEVNRSPEMGALVKQYLTNWYCAGGGLLNYFALSGPQTEHGSWGAFEDISETTTAKYQAIVDIAAGKFTCP